MASIPAVGTISDISNVQVALVQGGTQLVRASLPGIAAALKATMGAGDVSGPSSATDGNLAAFDGDGLTLKDSGSKPSDFATAAQGTKADNAMPKAGGIMTGNLIISIAAGGYLAINSNPGSYSYFKGMKGNKNRWFAYFGDATAETGGNAGSDFGISRFGDDGTFLGNPLYIERSTGAVKFGAPTGGYPDAEGKANFVDVEIQGESVKDALDALTAKTTAYESAEQTPTLSGNGTLAHGLGVKPKSVWPVLICKTAEHGFAVGDEVPAEPINVSGIYCGVYLRWDATNIYYAVAARTAVAADQSTFSAFNPDPAKWNLIVRARL